MSARARIVGWMLFLVALALSVSLSATWSILLNRLDARVSAELENETEKLRRFVDNETRNSRPASAAALLDLFLSVNAPDRWETYFRVVGDEVKISGVDRLAAVEDDEALVQKIAAVTDRPMAGWTDSAAGRVRYAAIPVQVGDEVGQFVVAVFYDAHREEVVASVQVLAITGLAALGLAGGAGWFVAGRALAPIRLVRQTAEAITDSSDLTRRLEVTGNDDVAALAATFNHMLDRLDRAFAAQRTFADDAGHELRTPITVIRGHLELMGDDPDDQRDTLALVNDELIRMNRLVDDLLTLAKAGQPNFVTLEPVELAELTVGAVARARALADRKWRVDEVAEDYVLADQQRLTQALMQLMANAVRHTNDGDLVAVGSAVRDGQVVLWVRDSGPGVPPEDRERIFQRFERSRIAGEGSGLGLSIVRSIAEAHEGRAFVMDAPGGGAQFVLTFPFVFEEPA
ncbi:sensor histidine kinase [Herbidospora mongoliensis]|uniref:sensor histidine kinase n=1 Tax=Herbidospora mongoliensis TaxID=688067 RepID=UPI00082AB002|nr:HAMP domain-containing sensor histidine kinase [Herbidospora mongoliensis]